MAALHYIVCGRHAERACLGDDASLGEPGSSHPVLLPPSVAEAWRTRALTTPAWAGPERAAALARRAGLLSAFELRHKGCPLYHWSEGQNDQPIRLARLEAGWPVKKSLELLQEFDLDGDDPSAGNAPPEGAAPGRSDMMREIRRRQLTEPDPIPWTRTKKPKQPRPANPR